MPVEAKEEVMQALQQFLSAFERLDFERLAACFAQDEGVSVIFPSTTRRGIYRGWTAVERAWREVLQDEKYTSQAGRIKLAPSDLTIQVFGETAICTFLVNSDPPAVAHRRTIVFLRRDGRWLIVHLHGSNLDE
jgi:ketosteroid isomerase-like protein